uniref:Cupin-like domain-containing protein n=1 Tax=viral metagenome TaxID=1070528 RepID=A0A6C0E517_9ZZZZ
MLNWAISIFIFCVVLFIYLHINFHFKTSNDLEIYEIDNVSKEKFEELCDIRQPIIFPFENEKIINNTCYDYIYSHYDSFDIQIRESAFNKQSIKNTNNNTNIDSDVDVYVPLSLNLANKLFVEDDTETYYSANNTDFLKETGVIKSFQYNDEFLRPYMLCNSKYDVMSGSNNTVTPFKYELNYRNFFLVTQGAIEVKMTPPKSTKYLYPVKDYELFEFKSPVNPWNVSPEYKADFDKIKCLEFTVTQGKALYIPAYWWYSIKFHKNTSISSFKYKTYMNCVSIIPDLSLHGLQLQNIKRNTVKITKKYNINHSIESTEKKVLPTSGDEIPNKIERNIPAIPNIDTTSQNITANIPTIPESSIALSSTNISDLSTVINI